MEKEEKIKMTPTKDYHDKIIGIQNVLSINTAAQIAHNKKCVIVTGVTGQDGSHMVDFLLANTEIKDSILLTST